MNSKNEGKIRDRLAFLMDGEYCYPELTLNQMKNVFKDAYSNWNEDEYQAYIKKFGLNPKQKILKLSRGMKMQFFLSLALSHNAEILILDEPTSGLDPLMRHELIKILKELAKKGVTILFSSHITSDIEKIADGVILINSGKIIFHKEVKKLENSYFVVTGNENLLNEKNKKFFIYISEENKKFRGILEGDLKNIIKSFKEDTIVKPANIEDIMLAYICGNRV